MSHATVSTQPLAHLPSAGVALLTTFRRNGEGIGTPVGIHILNDKVYFTTWSTTGKVKRLRATSRVTLAPSTRQGKATGPAIEGIARRLDGADAATITVQLDNRVWRWIWLLIYRVVFRASAVLYEVTPV